jgi:hypothetical protein
MSKTEEVKKILTENDYAINNDGSIINIADGKKEPLNLSEYSTFLFIATLIEPALNIVFTNEDFRQFKGSGKNNEGDFNRLLEIIEKKTEPEYASFEFLIFE